MNKRYYFVLIIIIFLGITGSSYYSSMKSNKVSTDMGSMEAMNMHPIDTSSSTNEVSSSVSSTTTKPSTPASPKTYSISIQGFVFSPKLIEVKVGDTIVWTNKDGAPHTVTSDVGSELASVNLGDNDTYSHTFTKADIFNYHCAVHPGMKATVIVR